MLDVTLTLTICIPFCFLLLISPFSLPPSPSPSPLRFMGTVVSSEAQGALLVPLPLWEKGGY